MNKKILFYLYRDWAKRLVDGLDIPFKYINPDNSYDNIDKMQPDLIFFIGWSHIVPDEIIKKYKCICLHPSPLPKYRGGSPIQNQIINGEKKSAVTLFYMNDKLDGGDILYQSEISLDGELDDIFDRIIKHGRVGIEMLINSSDISVFRIPQKLEDGFVCKRRKPEDSEIKISDLINSTPEELYNKIRALNDPYPNAFIRCKNDEKLYILKTRF